MSCETDQFGNLFGWTWIKLTACNTFFPFHFFIVLCIIKYIIIFLSDFRQS
ncbi:hypothetical protein Hanom_Chr12g01080351 [Helianthus anomalus]